MAVNIIVSDELFSRINVDDFERPWTPKIRGFIVFGNFQLRRTLLRVNCDEMAGDRLIRKFATGTTLYKID